MTVECHKQPNEARPDQMLQVAGFGSVAAGRARPGRGYFLLGLALAGPHFFVRGRPVAWPAVGRVGRAKSGQAGYMAGLALAGLWPD